MIPHRILSGCTLAALLALAGGCKTGVPNPRDAPRAEMIAFYGHGKLFDREMNEIEPDLELLTEIQRDILQTVERQDFAQKRRTSTRELREADSLMRSRDFSREEQLVIRGGMIENYLRDAPTEIRARYGWRSGAIVSAYLNENRYQLSPRLRELIARLYADPNEGDDTSYMTYCRENEVPIPPDWAETGTAWVEQGTLTQNLLGPGEYAAVWTYTDRDRRGGCIALPRGDGEWGAPGGIICQSAATGAACFWDNILREPPGPEEFIGWRGRRLVISELKDGSNLNGPCTQCHQGSNVFIISPDDPTWARVLRGVMAGSQPGTFTTRVEFSSDHLDDEPRYVPLTTVPARAGWANERRTTRCGSCHEGSVLEDTEREPPMPPACEFDCYRP